MSTVSNIPSGLNPYLVGYSTNDISGSDTTANKYSQTASTNKNGTSSSGSYSQGLISQMTGIDVNNMVNESMSSDVIKLNKLLATQQQSQWTQDRYRSIITNLQNFSSKYFDVLSSNYILSNNVLSTNLATPSDTNILNTNAANNAKAGVYTVTQATLATAANITANVNSKPAAAATLSSFLGISSPQVMTFSVKGQDVSYKLDPNATISSTMQNLSSSTGLNFSYSELTGKFSIATQATGSAQNIDIQDIDANGANFFSKFGLNVTSGGAIATYDTASLNGSGVIKNTAALPSDKISDTNLSLTNGDTLSFTINGVVKTYTVDTSKTVDMLMSDLSSLTSSVFGYDASTGKISTKSIDGSSSLNISYASGSSAQTFFNNAFGAAAGSTSIASAAGTAEIDGISVVGNPSKSAIASASDKISATGLNSMAGTSLNIGGKSYTIDGNKTVSALMSDLSTLTGATFSYDASTGKVSIEKTGATSFDIHCDDSNTQAFFNTQLGLGTGADITNSTSSTTQGTGGQDGSFTIKEPGDTTATTVNQSSNNFTIDGVSYNFSSAVDASNPVTINVKQDVSSAVSKIQDFVTDYNNLIAGISSVTSEKRDYTYAPLTSSQESQMTASQITAWNEKAQSGLLANDGTLNDMLTAMREAFYTPVIGNASTMGGIGLSTSDDPKDGGKIFIDVKKLTTALQNNPQQVTDLFTKPSTSYYSYESAINVNTSTDMNAVGKAVNQRSSEEGIFQRISDIEKKYAGTYIDKNGNQGILLMKAGDTNSDYSKTRNILYKQIKEQADAVSNFKEKMQLDSKMYNKKFSALQSALSQLSSQQNYFSSMLGNAS